LAISGFEHFFDLESSEEEKEEEEKEEEEKEEEDREGEKKEKVKMKISSPKGKSIVFPHLHKQHLYEDEFGDNETEVDGGVDPATLPQGSYLLVKAENVTKKSHKKAKVANTSLDEPDCEKDWKMVNDIIIDDIESALPYKKQQLAKNLAKSMLNSKHFCISKDGKSVMIKNQSKTATSLLDFLNTATRSSGPNEIPDAKFVLFTKLLLQSKTPMFYFKNKSLLNPPMRQKASSMGTRVAVKKKSKKSLQF